MRKLFGVVALVAVLVMTGGQAVLAASKKSSEASDGANQASAVVEGFRSAKFGMSEDDVRKAMRNDFSMKDAQIEREENPIERTAVLSADVRDLMPGSGPARTSYVFGFSSKKLIHVNVLWAREMGNTTLEQLATVASSLQVYFAGQGYKPDSVVTNAALPDGSVLIFRGSDAKGRMVLLVANGLSGKKEDKAAADKAFVRLSYVLSPNEPDIFKLKPGQF